MRKVQRRDDGTATIYARVSKDKTGAGLAVERQIEECRALCERNGWKVREIFSDNDISATKGKPRPGFEALLRSKPNRIVCWHTDRLVRLTRELERVIELDVEVHAVKAGIHDLQTATGRATAKTIAAWSQAEGELKAERMQLKYLQARKAGEPHWAHRPFGLHRDGQLHEVEAPLVVEAYERLIGGASMRSIAAWLNSAEGGLPERVNAQGIVSRRKPWTGSTLARFLKDARNCGIATYHGEELGPGNWEAIIPEDTYRAAMRILRDPARATGGDGRRRFLLSGLALCGECGAKVKGGSVLRTGPYKGDPMYACEEGHIGLPVPWADGRAFLGLVRVLEDPANRHLWGGANETDEERLAALQSERHTLNERLSSLGEDYAVGLIDRVTMLAGVEKVRDRLDDVDAELADMARADALARYFDVEAVAERLHGMDEEQLRGLLDGLCVVTLHRRGKGHRGFWPELVDVRPKSTAD